MPVIAIWSFLLLLVVAYFIARPLMVPERPERQDPDETLLVEKKRLLTEIRELDMDHATGKLTDEDFHLLRARSLAEAAATMRALDEAQERARAAGREEAPPNLGSAAADRNATDAEDELERAIAARRSSFEASRCPECGVAHDSDDYSCRNCGAELATPSTGEAR